jgi:hypothetical protein
LAVAQVDTLLLTIRRWVGLVLVDVTAPVPKLKLALAEFLDKATKAELVIAVITMVATAVLVVEALALLVITGLLL